MATRRVQPEPRAKPEEARTTEMVPKTGLASRSKAGANRIALAATRSGVVYRRHGNPPRAHE